MTFEEFVEELKEDFGNIGYTIEQNVDLLSDSWKKHTADVVIQYEDPNKSNFAVIVATSEAKGNEIDRSYAKRLVRAMVQEYDYWVGVVWDKGEIFLFDPSNNENKWVEITILGLLSSAVNPHMESKIPDDYKTQLLAECQKLSEVVGENERETLDTFIDWLKMKELKDEQFELKNRMATVSLELQLKLLLKFNDPFKGGANIVLCRYTSLEGLRRILIANEESLCGLAAMNDKSEGFYLEKCLTNTSFNLYRKPQSVVDKYNEAFIVSLCDESKVDDLTMWRFYGSDGKGCCLTYELNKDKLDHEGFILLPVFYGPNSAVVKLFKILQQLPYIGGVRFGLSYQYIWNYFVKPGAFEVEKEYRLLKLYSKSAIKDKEKDKAATQNPPVPEQKWVLNGNIGIFHPVLVYPSPLTNAASPFPMHLKRIMLGPKCQEVLINKVQLRSLMINNRSTLDISNSKIDFYR